MMVDIEAIAKDIVDAAYKVHKSKVFCQFTWHNSLLI